MGTPVLLLMNARIRVCNREELARKGLERVKEPDMEFCTKNLLKEFAKVFGG